MEREDLMRIIKNYISNKNQELKDNKIPLEDLDTLYKQLTENIIGVNLNLLSKILLEINKDNPNYNIDNDLKYFNILQFMIKNNTYLTKDYKINEEQKDFLNKLVNTLKKYIDKRTKEKEETQRILSSINSITELLEIINDETKYITDISIINEIFSNENIDHNIRYNILAYILKRNRDVYLKKVSPTITISKEEQLIELFKKYNYDYNQIDTEYKNQFIKYGNLLNIENMLKLLNPYRNIINTKDSAFSLLLLYSNEEIFNELKNIASKNEISIREFFKYPSIFIKKIPEELTDNKEVNKYTPVPSYDTFINNKEIISNLGFSFRQIFKNIPIEITGPSDRILSNLRLIRLYNIPPSGRHHEKSYSYSILKRPDTFKKVDQYIELGQ